MDIVIGGDMGYEAALIWELPSGSIVIAVKIGAKDIPTNFKWFCV